MGNIQLHRANTHTQLIRNGLLMAAPCQTLDDHPLTITQEIGRVRRLWNAGGQFFKEFAASIRVDHGPTRHREGQGRPYLPDPDISSEKGYPTR